MGGDVLAAGASVGKAEVRKSAGKDLDSTPTNNEHPDLSHRQVQTAPARDLIFVALVAPNMGAIAKMPRSKHL